MKRRLRSAVSSAVDARAAPVVPVARTASAAVLAVAVHRVRARRGGALEEAARQPLDSISERAVALLRARHEDDPTLRIGGGELDARLRLRRCTAPLDASIAPGSGDVGLVTVQVRCPVSSGWRVHVRLDVSRERVLWTFARSARRGEVLGPDLVTRTTVSLGRAESRLARAGVPIETLEPWLGHELVRDVDAGRPLVADRARAASPGDARCRCAPSRRRGRARDRDGRRGARRRRARRARARQEPRVRTRRRGDRHRTRSGRDPSRTVNAIHPAGARPSCPSAPDPARSTDDESRRSARADRPRLATYPNRDAGGSGADARAEPARAARRGAPRGGHRRAHRHRGAGRAKARAARLARAPAARAPANCSPRTGDPAARPTPSATSCSLA